VQKLRAERRAALALIRLVEPVVQCFASLEERNALIVDRNAGAGARIAADAGASAPHRKCPEAAQLDTVSAGERGGDLFEDQGDDHLDVMVIQPRRLDPSRDMHRLDGGDRRQADARAPRQEFLRGAVVGPARVRVADIGGEEFEKAH